MEQKVTGELWSVVLPLELPNARMVPLSHVLYTWLVHSQNENVFIQVL